MPNSPQIASGRWRFEGLCNRETDNATITAERVYENEGREVASRLGVSNWTALDLVNSGVLPRVRLPLGNRDMRRVLVDRLDVERLIQTCKDTPQ